MNKIDEVKKILADYGILRLTGEIMAREICQLFPKTKEIHPQRRDKGGADRKHNLRENAG